MNCEGSKERRQKSWKEANRSGRNLFEDITPETRVGTEKSQEKLRTVDLPTDNLTKTSQRRNKNASSYTALSTDDMGNYINLLLKK